MRDLRKYARQTNGRLVLGGLLLVFIVGLGLIDLIYGRAAALAGLACLLAFLGVAGLTALILSAMQKAVDRANKDL